MAEFGNGLADESLLDSDPGHSELEDPGAGDEEPGLDEGEAAIEDPVSEGRIIPALTTNFVFCKRFHPNFLSNLTFKKNRNCKANNHVNAKPVLPGLILAPGFNQALLRGSLLRIF